LESGQTQQSMFSEADAGPFWMGTNNCILTIATKGIMTKDDPKFKSAQVFDPAELTVNRCNGGFLYRVKN
jgi:hypothetical protein